MARGGTHLELRAPDFAGDIVVPLHCAQVTVASSSVRAAIASLIGLQLTLSRKRGTR